MSVTNRIPEKVLEICQPMDDEICIGIGKFRGFDVYVCSDFKGYSGEIVALYANGSARFATNDEIMEINTIINPETRRIH